MSFAFRRTLFFAFSAIGAAIAGEAARALAAGHAVVMRNIQLFLRYFNAPIIIELKFYRLSSVLQTGAVRLARLDCLIRYAVNLAVFYEDRASLNEIKGHVMHLALVIEKLHPLIAAWAAAVVVFTAAEHLLDLPLVKVAIYVDLVYERCAHNALMLKGKSVENGDSLVGALLIFARHVKKDVLPAVAPVGRKRVCHPLRTLREKKKFHVSPLSYDTPRITSPFVRLFKEKIRRHAHANHFAALDLVASAALFLERVIKPRLRFKNVCAVFVADAVKKIHVAILTALAALHAPVPRIPYVMHRYISLFVH